MFVSVIIQAIRRWRQLRADIRAVAALSDHELADLGLRRSGIEGAVRDARAGKERKG